MTKHSSQILADFKLPDLQGSCLTGQTPRLPFVADAADQQIR